MIDADYLDDPLKGLPSLPLTWGTCETWVLMAYIKGGWGLGLGRVFRVTLASKKLASAFNSITFLK